MNYNAIGRPHIIIKVMERRWIKEMYENGSIRFYAPGKWIQCEIGKNKGQGDKYEGVFAIDRNLEDREEKLRKRYGKQLIVNLDGKNKYYQLRKTIESPTYCFYSLTDKDLNAYSDCDKEGRYWFSAEIDGQFFKDFANGMTEEEVNKLPPEERPVMLIIFGYENIRCFINKVKQALKDKYGIIDSQFLVDQVKYDYSRKGSNSYTAAISYPPKELFHKGKEFADQREGRIIINSKKYKFQDYDNEFLDIEIGSMKEFASIQDVYTPEGHRIIVEAQLSSVENIIKRDGQLYEGYGGM